METRANSEEHETVIMLRHEANAAEQKVAKKEKLVEDLRAEKRVEFFRRPMVP